MSDTDSTDTYTVSFKTSPGYDASLIVVRGNTPDELAANVTALQEEVAPDTSLVSLVVETENLVHVAYAALNPLPAAQPAGQGTSSGGGTSEVRMCAHGKRTRREGTSAKGPWVGYFCALPKGAEGSCKAEFENTK